MAFSGYHLWRRSLGNRFGFSGRRVAKAGLAAVLSGALSASLLTPATSQAAFRSTDSSGGWSVNEISADGVSAGQSSGQSYCVMARKFDNDVILSVAKNHKGQKSLAIDFQSSRLDSNKNYKVVLKSGNDLARAFEVRPVTSKAFVIRLGEDTGFFKAMNNAAPLSVHFESGSLKFETSSFDKGHQALDKCLDQSRPPLLMASAQSGQARVIDAAGTTGGHRPEKTAISSGHNSGTSAETSAETSKVSSDQRMARLETAAGQTQTNSNSQSDGISGSKSQEMKELKERIARLEQENRSLKAAKARKSSGTEEITRLRKENKNLNATLDKILQQNLKLKSSLESAQDKLQQSEQVIARLKQMNESFESRLSDAGSAQQARALNASLKQENNELKQRLARMKSDHMSIQSKAEKMGWLKDELARAQNRLDTVTSEKEELMGELSKLEKAHKQARKVSADPEMCLSSMNWNLEMATRRYQEAQREIRRLGSKLRESRNNCQSEIRQIENQLFAPDGQEQASSERFNEMRNRLVSMSDELKKQRVLSKRRIRDLETKIAELKVNPSDPVNEYASESYSERIKPLKHEGNSRRIQNNETQNKQNMSAELYDARPPATKRNEMSDNAGSDLPAQAATNRQESPGAPEQKPLSLTRSNETAQIDQQSGRGIQYKDDNNARGLGKAGKSSETNEFIRKLAFLYEDVLQENDVKKFIDMTDMNLAGKVNALPGGNTDGKQNSARFIWDTGSLMASARRVSYSLGSLTGQSGFENNVKEYINALRSHCQGGFSSSQAEKVLDAQSNMTGSLYRFHCERGQNQFPVFKTMLFIGKTKAESNMMTALSFEGDMSSVGELNSITESLRSQMIGIDNSLPSS